MALVMQQSSEFPAPLPCMCRRRYGHSSGEAAQAPRAPGASAAPAEARAQLGTAVSETMQGRSGAKGDRRKRAEERGFLGESLIQIGASAGRAGVKQ